MDNYHAKGSAALGSIFTAFCQNFWQNPAKFQHVSRRGGRTFSPCATFGTLWPLTGI